MTNLFVYGSLRNGGGWHSAFLSNSPFIGIATVPGQLWDDKPLPCLKPAPDGDPSRVTGEIYTVDDATLRGIDGLEGHPNWYRREKVTATLPDGTTVPVETYFYLPDLRHAELVDSGDWLTWSDRRM